MIEWYRHLSLMGRLLVCSIGNGLFFFVVFTIVSGEPLMGAIGFPMGMIAAPALYRWSTRLSRKKTH